MRRRHALAALTMVGVALLTGCGEASKDAPRGTENTGSADVLLFPDGFSNVAHKCDGPNMVYSATNGANNGGTKSTRSAVAVVPNDPRCKQGTP